MALQMALQQEKMALRKVICKIMNHHLTLHLFTKSQMALQMALQQEKMALRKVIQVICCTTVVKLTLSLYPSSRKDVELVGGKGKFTRSFTKEKCLFIRLINQV
jgi:hypothetical protein